jgi:hypothetical protein
MPDPQADAAATGKSYRENGIDRKFVRTNNRDRLQNGSSWQTGFRLRRRGLERNNIHGGRIPATTASTKTHRLRLNIGAVCRRFRTRLFRKHTCDLQTRTARATIHMRNTRAAGVPVMCTNAVYHGEALNDGRFSHNQKAKPMRHFLEGRPRGAWPACFDVSGDELVVSKQYPAALHGASLASTLTTWASTPR